MTPLALKYSLDIITLLLGVYVIYIMRKSTLGGAIGTALQMVIAGIFILTINHFLDTAYLADGLKRLGHVNDYFQAPIVHRVINLVGFLFMAAGFSALTNKMKK